jgi:hypothetical protein
MGRYYTGDIEGKFWFGLQPSNSPSRFGGTEQEPAYITYDFQIEDLEDVENEIEVIKKSLGEKFNIIEDFCNKNETYTNDMLSEIEVTQEDLKDYADLLLGIQIRDCIKEQDYCTFDAEL